MSEYYNALRGAYYFPFIVRAKDKMRVGKTARERARKSGQPPAKEEKGGEA
jgi:hypothetical protein